MTQISPLAMLWTSLCRRFLTEEQGQALAEYVLLFILVVVVSISLVAALGQDIGELMGLLPAFFAGRS